MSNQYGNEGANLGEGNCEEGGRGEEIEAVLRKEIQDENRSSNILVDERRLEVFEDKGSMVKSDNLFASQVNSPKTRNLNLQPYCVEDDLESGFHSNLLKDESHFPFDRNESYDLNCAHQPEAANPTKIENEFMFNFPKEARSERAQSIRSEDIQQNFLQADSSLNQNMRMGDVQDQNYFLKVSRTEDTKENDERKTYQILAQNHPTTGEEKMRKNPDKKSEKEFYSTDIESKTLKNEEFNKSAGGLAEGAPVSKSGFKPLSKKRDLKEESKNTEAIESKESKIETPMLKPRRSARTRKKNIEYNYDKRGCDCPKNRCIQLYCDCFGNGNTCSNDCTCNDCENLPENENLEVLKRQIIEKNPNAFRKKFCPPSEGAQSIDLANSSGAISGQDKQVVDSSSKRIHLLGCRCKQSHCLQNYCECKKNGIECGPRCKCLNCNNC